MSKAMILAMLSISGCAFDPLGMEYHETAANKTLRLQNEATIAQYWKDRGIDPDAQ